MSTPQQAAAWNGVMSELGAACAAYNRGQPEHARLPVEPSEDDVAMWRAADSDLLAWCADLEDRVGLDVEGFRAALLDYITARAVAQLDAAGIARERNEAGNWVVGGREYSDIAFELRDALLPALRDGVQS